MKLLTLAFFLAVSLDSQANIEASSAIQVEPTASALASSRSCFSELSANGCRHPSEDPEQFRTCLKDVFPTLNDSCQAMMKRLYGK